MNNTVIIIGTIEKKENLITLSDDECTIDLIVGIEAPYKNNEDIYEKDFIKCTVYGDMANNCNEYGEIGDIVGIKGKITPDKSITANESKHLCKIISDKVTFLSSEKLIKQEDEREL